MSSEEDDVPPLEDMTDYLQELKTKQSSPEQLPTSKKPEKKPTKKHVSTTDSSLLELENPGPQSSKNLLICEEAKHPASSNSSKQDSSTASLMSKASEPQSSANARTKTSTSSSFGGMKKGFLFGSGSKPQRKAAPTNSMKTQSNGDSSGGSSGAIAGKKEEMPFLKPQQEDKQAGMRLDEVQEEMKKTYPLLQTQDWISDDLLSKISQSPVLSKAFQDPALLQTLQQFHQNPQETMAQAQHNPEMRTFLQEFCSLMGDHFTALADKEDKGRSKDKSQISEATSPEQQQMNDLLTVSSVREALSDPNIQTLIQLLRTEPDRAQRFLQNRPPEFHERVKVLIDNGLLAFQK